MKERDCLPQMGERRGDTWYIVMYDTDLVVGVGNHGRLPLTVHLLVPVLRHLGVRVCDVLRLLPLLRRHQALERGPHTRMRSVYTLNGLSRNKYLLSRVYKHMKIQSRDLITQQKSDDYRHSPVQHWQRATQMAMYAGMCVA